MQLTEKLRRFLNERRFAVMATVNEDGSPHQTVMWYALQGDRILMNTRVGRIKESNLERDPRLSLCIEDEYNFVTLEGRVEFDYDRERSQAGIGALAARYEGEEDAARMVQNRFSKQNRVNLYLTIERWHGEGSIWE